MKTLKELIKEANKKMTMEQLAKAVGTNRQTIYDILGDKYKNGQTLATIKKFCKYFGVDYHDYV